MNRLEQTNTSKQEVYTFILLKNLCVIFCLRFLIQ